MSRLHDYYKKEIIPKMREMFGYKNNLATPKIEKITINIGLGDALERKDPKITEVAKETILKITGQKPVETKSKKSIAGFKIREGLVVGLKVTLRKNKMYDFLDKLINVTIPRTRDFRGIDSSSIDQRGNLSLGFREQPVFPEINSQAIEKIHGLQITISSSTLSKEEGLALFKFFGFPFK